MKRQGIRFVFLVAVLALTSCHDWYGDCIRGNSRIVSEVRDVPFFHSIIFNGSYDLELTYGDDFYVEIEGPSNIVNRIYTDVRNETLTIESNQCFRSSSRITVYITMPVVESIWLMGSGNIRSTNTLISDDLNIHLEGSGNIDIEMDAITLFASIVGSGDMDLYGISDDQDIRISGSGDVNAFGLESLRCDIQITGSGNVEVDVVEDLDVIIRGSGSVYYRGNPRVSSSITGSGGVFDAG